MSHSKGNQNKAPEPVVEKPAQATDAKAHSISVILEDDVLHQSFVDKMAGTPSIDCHILCRSCLGWTGTDIDTVKIVSTQTFVYAFEEIFLIIADSIRKVIWQDGTGTPEWKHSTDFIPKKYLLDCDFWPGKYVTRVSVEQDRLGFVTSVNSKDKTAEVMWLNNQGRLIEVLRN